MIRRLVHTHTIGTMVVLLLIAILAACSPRPKGVLSASKMEEVLYDIHRAEGILYVKGYEYGHYEKNAKYYQGVLLQHGITQAEFDSSLVWYTDNPKRFDKIYPKVIDRLTKEKDALAAINEQARVQNSEQKAQDTISTLPVRTADDWMRIMQYGLPLEWFGDMTIDTTFVYPYLSALQDSIQQVLCNDTVAAVQVVTDKVAPAEEKEENTMLRIKKPGVLDKLSPKNNLIKK